MVLVLPSSLARLFTSIRLIVYRMVKRVRRLVSGQCAVARICGDSGGEGSDALPPHTSSMTAALWKEWRMSARLKPSFDEYGLQPDMSVDGAVDSICKVKKLEASNPCVTNLRRCLEDIKGVNCLRQAVHARANTKFNSDNEAHEAELERLWQALLPGETRTGGRYSKEWNRIGFQQSDPASDFRGGGMLALDQLLHIATTRTSLARRMIVEPAAEMSRYPWACVGINLTNEVKRVVDEHLLDIRLYGKTVDAGLLLIHDVYADMFEILHHRWVQANPENLLAFPDLFKAVLKDVDEQLRLNATLVPPGTTA